MDGPSGPRPRPLGRTAAIKLNEPSPDGGGRGSARPRVRAQAARGRAGGRADAHLFLTRSSPSPGSGTGASRRRVTAWRKLGLSAVTTSFFMAVGMDEPWKSRKCREYDMSRMGRLPPAAEQAGPGAARRQQQRGARLQLMPARGAAAGPPLPPAAGARVAAGVPRSASARGCQRGPAARPGPPCALRRRYRSTKKIKRKQEAGRRRAERPARYGRKSGAKLPLRSVLLLAAAEQPLPGAELRPFRAKRSLPRKVLRINPEPAARAPGAGLKGAPLVWRPRSPAGTRCRPAARHSSAPLGCRESPYFPRLLKVTVGHVWERGAAQGAEGVGKCFCWAARPNLVRAWGGSGGKGSVTGVVARCRNHLSELRAARSAN